MFRIGPLSFIALLFLCSFAFADAPSFDCKKATTKVEKAICENASLSRLDKILNNIYGEKRVIPAFKDSILASQREWLRTERAKCENPEKKVNTLNLTMEVDTRAIRRSCLSFAYETRIEALLYLSDSPRNPYGNYEFLLKTVTNNRNALIKGSSFVNFLERPYCIARIDSLIHGELTPIEPNYRVQTEQGLQNFLKKEYNCNGFSHSPYNIEAGNHSWQFFQEAPFLIFQFQHQSNAYFALLGSGAYKDKDHPNTPAVDYENETFPVFMIYNGKNCEFSSAEPVYGIGREERGISAFSGFLAAQDGSVYYYGIRRDSSTGNGASISIHPLFPTKRNRCSSSFR